MYVVCALESRGVSSHVTTYIFSAENLQRHDDNASHVEFHGKCIDMVVALIVPADLGCYDPLYEGMQETACEKNSGVITVFLRSGCWGHECVCIEGSWFYRSGRMSGRSSVWF